MKNGKWKMVFASLKFATTLSLGLAFFRSGEFVRDVHF